jgi:hypothetical protein
MDEYKEFIECKNKIKYRTDVVIHVHVSAENRKDIGRFARMICGFEIHASL